MRPTYVIPVHGTWDLNGKKEKCWWEEGSDFNKLAEKNNIFYGGSEPFIWSGRVDGINWKTVLTFGLSKDSHDDWRTAGYAFRHYIKPYKLVNRNCIIHSHGLQLVAYANIKLNNIITVGSPIRKDMFPLYEQLLNNCESWLHIYDEVWDRMGFLGQVGDGKWFGSRACMISAGDKAVNNHKLKSIDHSRILRQQPEIGKWETQGWFDFLRK